MGQGTGQRGDRDLETEIEDEMRASGRGHVVPREGRAGAYEQRREGMGKDLDERLGEPPGRGAEVAPTALAEARERERHERQRKLGVVPAGTDGALRQRRDGTATREQLDAAGEDADESLMEQRLYEEQEALEAAETEAQRWSDRAGAWLNQHRRTMTFVAGAAVIAAVGFMTAARMRD
jgi:hypothetical protein